MKKIKLIIALLLSAIFLLAATACGGGGLETPSGFDIDEENLLSWEAVEGARSYRIRITSVATSETKEDVFRTPSYSLASLEEGDYEISVMAQAGSQSSAEVSDWSSVIRFHKNYETGLLYELIGGNTEYRILRVGSAEGKVVIENEYRGKPVTEIAEKAFRASSRVTELVIGENVRTIGASAFYNCKMLSSVTIPDSVTSIGESAFQGCNGLTSVKLPSNLQMLPLRAFAYCRNLVSIELNDALEYISESAFYECSALTEVEFPDSVSYIGTNAFASDTELTDVTFGKGLRVMDARAFNDDTKLEHIAFKELDGELTIGTNAFQNCPAISEITLPEGVTELGDYVFALDTLLENVELPTSLRKIGAGAFNQTELYNAQLADASGDGYVYVGDWLVNVSPEKRNSIVNLNGEALRQDVNTVGIASSVFTSANALVGVQFPASVKYVGERAFYSCPNLYFVTNEEGSLEYIGNAAFANCGGLSQLRLSEGVKEIDNYAFYGCTSVNNPTSGGTLIPRSVTRIGTYAFEGTGLSPDNSGVIYAGDWVVGYDADTLAAAITLNNSTVGIADYAFMDATGLSNVQGGITNVQYIGTGAFARCSALSIINLNMRLREIKPFTFYKCTSLQVVDLPRQLTEIGDYAFYVCEKLWDINFSTTNITRIGSHAFFMCGNITEISFDRELEEIADYAFYQCGIKSLTLPASVKVLGERAFGVCMELQSVTFSEGLEGIGAFAFRNCRELTEISLPNSLKTIGDYAFYGCGSLTSVRFGSGLESIGKFAFSMSAVRSVALPASLKYLGESAFKGCWTLQSVLIYGTTEFVGANAFYSSSLNNSYGLSGLTVYIVGQAGEHWAGNWNSNKRPVVTGCVFSEDGYLVSVTLESSDSANGKIWGGLAAPAREGYVFAGWALSEGATEAELDLNGMTSASAGTTLYAVWKQAEE